MNSAESMPPARPSISASSGVVDDTVAKAVAAKIPAIEIPTPRTAVSSGRPATTKERNVTISTSSAMTRPTASVSVTPGIEIANRSPPSLSCVPSGSSPRRSSTIAVSSSFVSSETSVAWPSNCSWTIAAVASSFTMPSTMSSYGEVAASTPSRSARSSTASSIGVL